MNNILTVRVTSAPSNWEVERQQNVIRIEKQFIVVTIAWGHIHLILEVKFYFCSKTI